MMKNRPELLSANMSALVRQDELDGKEHLVVPVVLIVEGVTNGVLYTRDELKKFPEAWNGRPVPIYHPIEGGKFVTANSPKERERRTVGNLYNCFYSNGKLKGEAWLDKAKLESISPETYNLLVNDQRVEVSTGLFYEKEVIEGEYRGKKYEGIVHNIRPDHLAVLPDQRGACSWDDGAGMPRVNQPIGDNGNEEPENMITKGIVGALKALRECVGTFMGNARSHKEVEDALVNLIKQREAVAENVFLVDVFPHEVIYEVWNGEGSSPRLFRTKYNKSGEGGVLQLDGPSEEVVVETSYKPANPIATNEPQRTPEPEANPLDKGDNMDREKKVGALIEKGLATEQDKEHLMALNEATFGSLFPEPPAKTPEVMVPVVPPVVETPVEPRTVDEFIGNAPEGIKAELEALVQEAKERRTVLVEKLVGNKRHTFTKEELEGMPNLQLEKLAQAVAEKPAANFAGSRGTGEPAQAVNAQAKITPLGIPGTEVPAKDK